MASFSIRLVRVVLPLACALAAAACSGSTAESVPTRGESPSEPQEGAPGEGRSSSPPPPAPTPTATTAPGACNAIENDALPITAEMVAATPPTPTGGVVADGTYRMTSLTVYTGPSGATGALPVTIQATISIQGSAANVVQVANGRTERVTETISTSGSTASFARTCPSTKPPKSGHYSATASTLTLFLPNDVGQTVAYVYTK